MSKLPGYIPVLYARETYRRIYGDLNLSNRLTSESAQTQRKCMGLTSESAQTQRKCMGENWHTAKYSVLTGLYLAKRAHSEGNYETCGKFVTPHTKCMGAT